MGRRILLIQGHPDPEPGHFGHALADAYAEGAAAAGHAVRRVEVARLAFPLLRSAEDWRRGEPPAAIAGVQGDMRWADHLVLLYPLWLGTMPAVTKAFLEQMLRQSFAFGDDPERPRRALRGRSARVVVTMGMPAWVYRGWFRAHSLKSLERNILRFCGVAPVRASLVGAVEGTPRRRERWLRRMRRHGRRAR